MGTVISLCARRQALTPPLPGVARLKGLPRLVDGKVVIASTLDDEALELVPSEARYLAAALEMLAEVAEREGGL